MKTNKSFIITVVALFLIILGLSSGVILEDYIGTRIVSVVTIATAIIGAAALFFQFKRDKDLNEASFLVEYSAQFYSVYDCKELMNELEKCRSDSEYKLDTEKYYTNIVGYLEWAESLAALVNSGILSLSKIDNLLSYRFFLIVNNKQIQDRELVPFREFYREIYSAYLAWSKYKKANGLPIILEENDLSSTENYFEMLK